MIRCFETSERSNWKMKKQGSNWLDDLFPMPPLILSLPIPTKTAFNKYHPFILLLRKQLAMNDCFVADVTCSCSLSVCHASPVFPMRWIPEQEPSHFHRKCFQHYISAHSIVSLHFRRRISVASVIRRSGSSGSGSGICLWCLWLKVVYYDDGRSAFFTPHFDYAYACRFYDRKDGEFRFDGRSLNGKKISGIEWFLFLGGRGARVRVYN